MGASLLALAKSIYYAPTTLQNDNPSDVKKKKNVCDWALIRLYIITRSQQTFSCCQIQCS